jgi:cyclopropane fatty-acyl-phospholipid synthase-like methyltransferase
MSDSFKYPGDELVLFQHATNWKKYFARQIKPYIKGNVLEIGAGIGSTTLLLNDGSANKWLMMEPDEQMSILLKKKIEDKQLPGNCRLQSGTIDRVSESFDTIIYIDVLEHIENDSEEMKKAAALLNADGHIIVLSPAFNHLFSPFDKAIGHCRRYNKRMIRNISPGGLQFTSSSYFDSAGYVAALMNKLFLRQKYPTLKQVKFWDNWLVPVSRIMDTLVFHSFGKSIIAIWNKRI